MIIHKLTDNLNKTKCGIPLLCIYIFSKEALSVKEDAPIIKITEIISEVTCEKCK